MTSSDIIGTVFLIGLAVLFIITLLSLNEQTKLVKAHKADKERLRIECDEYRQKLYEKNQSIQGALRKFSITSRSGKKELIIEATRVIVDKQGIVFFETDTHGYRRTTTILPLEDQMLITEIKTEIKDEKEANNEDEIKSEKSSS